MTRAVAFTRYFHYYSMTVWSTDELIMVESISSMDPDQRSDLPQLCFERERREQTDNGMRERNKQVFGSERKKRIDIGIREKETDIGTRNKSMCKYLNERYWDEREWNGQISGWERMKPISGWGRKKWTGIWMRDKETDRYWEEREWNGQTSGWESKKGKETGLGAEQRKVECLSRSDGQMRIETEGRTEKARGIDTKRGTEWRPDGLNDKSKWWEKVMSAKYVFIFNTCSICIPITEIMTYALHTLSFPSIGKTKGNWRNKELNHWIIVIYLSIFVYSFVCFFVCLFVCLFSYLFFCQFFCCSMVFLFVCFIVLHHYLHKQRPQIFSHQATTTDTTKPALPLTNVRSAF